KGLILCMFLSLTVLTVSPAQAADKECAPCHADKVADTAASAHAGLGCAACHEGAEAHVADSAKLPGVRFDLELCGGCHADQYGTYVYGDGVKTRFGGSPEKNPKTKDFAHYNDIVDGHGFTKEYNEERSHNFMLLDHFDIKRGKFDTCMQCKSTKVAYYWNSVKERVIGNDVSVKAGHMKEEIVIPKGTKVGMSTAFDAPYPNTHEVRVLVTLPDGRRFASYEVAGAAKDANWTWSALYALTVDGLPQGSPTIASGNGCNHCHNPHKVGRAKKGGVKGFRVIRKAELLAIGKKGLNPYKKSEMKFDEDKPLSVDGTVALCGQCHVEYVCGVSPFDKIDRDYFPWAKAAELERINRETFPGYGAYTTVKYVQDWKHGTGPLSSPNAPGNGIAYNTPDPIGEVLTKSQHPETETYWGSAHYGYGATCQSCHMPKLTKADKTTFTSHWMASPYKYASAESAGPFVKKFGVKDKGVAVCGGCHKKDLKARLDKAKKEQEAVYSQAMKVQDALVASLAAIKAAKDAKAAGRDVDAAAIKAAVDDHREAHVRWENLVVSENSMGFHNPKEVMAELKKAMGFAASAKKKAEGAVKPGPKDVAAK
ncbi:MAG TPA: ammonia-forming cytochrome c nitrite reductase subunit c552, partial [Nitrospirota bacterium]|nr:ammonia-forming cytochrome c nitrite reductase subunit c552 [Nitrospirota bacterium]